MFTFLRNNSSGLLFAPCRRVVRLKIARSSTQPVASLSCLRTWALASSSCVCLLLWYPSLVLTRFTSAVHREPVRPCAADEKDVAHGIRTPGGQHAKYCARECTGGQWGDSSAAATQHPLPLHTEQQYVRGRPDLSQEQVAASDGSCSQAVHSGVTCIGEQKWENQQGVDWGRLTRILRYNTEKTDFHVRCRFDVHLQMASCASPHRVRMGGRSVMIIHMHAKLRVRNGQR